MSTKIRTELENLSDTRYKEFSSKLLPGIDNVLGVRLPQLRKIAKRIAVDKDWGKFLSQDCAYFEETMLQGMVISYVKVNLSERLILIEDFLPKINNWSVCDSFCAGLKFAKTYQNEVWNFIEKYFYSDKEFYARFSVVMTLNYFINDDYINKIFEKLMNITSDKKYVVMAEAWLLSFCYKKYPQKTMLFINKSINSNNLKKLSLQKIKELK